MFKTLNTACVQPATTTQSEPATKPHTNPPPSPPEIVTDPALIFWAPNGYSDLRTTHTHVQPCMDKRSLLALRVITVRDKLASSRRLHEQSIQIAAIDSARTEVSLALWGEPAHRNAGIKQGDVILVYGIPAQRDRWLNIQGAQIISPRWRGLIRPEYGGTGGKSGLEIGNSIRNTLIKAMPECIDHFRDKTGLDDGEIARISGHDWTIERFLTLLHRPHDDLSGFVHAVTTARRIELETIFAEAGHRRDALENNDSALILPSNALHQIAKSLPFRLTSDQATAVIHIIRDLESRVPAARLINGDVGSGKTITFAIPAVIASRAGYNVAILAPNAPLASQIANELNTTFPGTKIHLITGDNKPASFGDNGWIAIGTTALINALKKQDIHLLVVDEEQKFATSQREALLRPHTNMITSSATPIPRSLARALYGMGDVSIIRQAHSEKHIETRIVALRERRTLLAMLSDTLQAGGKAAIVYAKRSPDAEIEDAASEQSESEAAQNDQPTSITQESKRPSPEILDAETAFADWQAVFTKALGEQSASQIALAHGGMDESAKQHAIDRMKSGDANLLIATSVIEVGTTIPNLRLLIVVNAERYGASQLHQLRGRLARNGGNGIFALYIPGTPEDDPDADSATPCISNTSMQRMQAVASTNDGFELAELDMQLRGIGHLATGSNLQSGRKPMTRYFERLTINHSHVAAYCQHLESVGNNESST